MARLGELAGPPADEAFLAGLRLAAREAIGRARRRAVRRRAVAIGSALAAALVAGLAMWPMWLGRHASAPAPAVSAQEIWRRAALPSMPVSLVNALVVCGETVYAPVEDAASPGVLAIDARTGRVRWRSDVASLGCLSADSRHVYCLASGRRAAELTALDARTGAVQWRYGPEGESPRRPAGPPTPVPGGRVCWATAAAVHLIDAGDGRPVWVRPIAGEGPISAPAADGKDLVVASAAAVYGLALETGEVLWRQAASPAASPLVRPLVEAGGGRVFVAARRTAGRDRLVCLDARTRTELWARDLPPVLHLLAGGERLYVRSQGVLALEARSGRPLWRYEAQGCSPMTMVGGLVCFVDSSESGRVVAVGTADGRKAWEIQGLRSCEPFLLAGGMGFLKSSDGVVRALARAAGS